MISQVPGERNFHVFYQLLAGASDDLLNELNLRRNASAYYYLSQRVIANQLKQINKSNKIHNRIVMAVQLMTKMLSTKSKML